MLSHQGRGRIRGLFILRRIFCGAPIKILRLAAHLRLLSGSLAVFIPFSPKKQKFPAAKNKCHPIKQPIIAAANAIKCSCVRAKFMENFILIVSRTNLIKWTN